MLTVLEVLNRSAIYLSEKGIESPRTNAELLLAYVLDSKRLELYLAYDKPLSDNEMELMREYLQRRAMNEPVQYIIGSVEFYGLKIKVNPSVLIPRPETEILVETILNLYDEKDIITLLDIGSGSGNIAISLAVNLPNSRVIATDVSDDAIELAKQNALEHNVEKRIKFIKHDILKNDFSEFPNFNIVVSNPPYVSSDQFENLQIEIKNYEPKLAVTDYADGYSFYNKISEKSYSHLANKGMLFFELSEEQYKKVEYIMLSNGFKNITIKKDYQDIKRVIYGVKK
jgi:release factor glutamine methyltransferase